MSSTSMTLFASKLFTSKFLGFKILNSLVFPEYEIEFFALSMLYKGLIFVDFRYLFSIAVWE